VLSQCGALPAVRSTFLSWGWDAQGTERTRCSWGMVPGQIAPSSCFPLFRFCGLIQVLVMNPDSSAPTEEAEGAREVLEVRLQKWGVGGE
jgi:hypothetical protein